MISLLDLNAIEMTMNPMIKGGMGHPFLGGESVLRAVAFLKLKLMRRGSERKNKSELSKFEQEMASIRSS